MAFYERGTGSDPHPPTLSINDLSGSPDAGSRADNCYVATARRHGLTIITGNDKDFPATGAEGLQSIQGTVCRGD